MYYFGALAIHLVLVFVFAVDVVRQPASALSLFGKVLWIAAFVLVPVFGIVVYAIWRMRQSRGL